MSTLRPVSSSMNAITPMELPGDELRRLVPLLAESGNPSRACCPRRRIGDLEEGDLPGSKIRKVDLVPSAGAAARRGVDEDVPAPAGDWPGSPLDRPHVNDTPCRRRTSESLRVGQDCAAEMEVRAYEHQLADIAVLLGGLGRDPPDASRPAARRRPRRGTARARLPRRSGSAPRRYQTTSSISLLGGEEPVPVVLDHLAGEPRAVEAVRRPRLSTAGAWPAASVLSCVR